MNGARGSLLVGVLLVGSWVLLGDAIDEATPMMDEIVAAMQVVLPLSLADDEFVKPANRERVSGALEKLAVNAEKLREHGTTQDAGFAYLSQSLARDARDAQKRFADGRPKQARFILRHITENCVACHSRLPDPHAHPLGEQLLADPVVAALPADERVTLEIATRQFERALSTYESIFSSEESSLESIDLDGNLEGYLEVSLRVSDQPDRAIAQLKQLAQRPDLPKRLEPSMNAWIASLESLRQPLDGTPIERARALMGPGPVPGPWSDPEAMVGLIAASGILHRYVASHSGPAASLAEAYYLLGVIESRVGRSFWTSQTEHFLEASIRSDPGGPFADAAFELLDEFLTLGFTGSEGTNIPEDVVERLNALQQLIANAHPTAGGP